MNLNPTAQHAADAYGVEELWRQHAFIEAEVPVSGLAFTLKQRPFVNHARMKINPN